MSKNEIKNLIDNAFLGQRKPEKICRKEAVEYADSEGKMVEEFFGNRNWNDLALKDLKNCYCGDYSVALAFMNVQAAAYYLPGFMKICIDEYSEADTLPLSLITLLSGGRSPEERKWSEALSDRLSTSQKQAVIEYLNYMRANHEDDFVGLSFEKAMEIFRKE